jgi:hypothetical protein
VKNQNITLKVNPALLRKAKILAAERGTSLSALLAGKLADAVGEDAEYEAARRHAFRKLEHGWHLGRGPAARSRRS